jgi:hypothetical protein
MCRERTALAKKEMEYWLAEAEEWQRLNSADLLEKNPDST